MSRVYQTEIAPGLKLFKTVSEFATNYQILDQVNHYHVRNNHSNCSQVESKLDYPVEITVDITGSEGSEFQGTDASREKLTKITAIDPRQKREVAQIKLNGEWNLVIKVTY